jgi:DNA (cytosine-5)-methyltransferase 1
MQPILWWTKAKRAQNVDDYETWLQGGVVPTLNAMDNSGDSFATVLIIDGTRVDDVRIYEDGIVPTVISRWGTGGGTVPAIAYSVREDAKANNFSATETEIALTLQKHQPSPQSHHAQLFIAEPQTVRRLTPVECERLQGFPDNWTAERFDEKKQAVVAQADSSRYKQMGNAVAVPVVDWIIKRMVANQ